MQRQHLPFPQDDGPDGEPFKHPPLAEHVRVEMQSHQALYQEAPTSPRVPGRPFVGTPTFRAPPGPGRSRCPTARV